MFAAIQIICNFKFSKKKLMSSAYPNYINITTCWKNHQTVILFQKCCCPSQMVHFEAFASLSYPGVGCSTHQCRRFLLAQPRLKLRACGGRWAEVKAAKKNLGQGCSQEQSVHPQQVFQKKYPGISRWFNFKYLFLFTSIWGNDSQFFHFFIFTPIWEWFPIWLIFFKRVETIN